MVLCLKARESRSLPGLKITASDAGWSSLVARQAHNLKVAGSNPAPATKRLMMKKILFVTSKINGGGSENVLRIISEKFAKLHYNVFILVLDDKDAHKPNNKNIKCFFLKKKKNYLIKSIFLNFEKILFARRSIKQIKPDVIFSFITETNILTILANISLGYKLIVSERNNPKLERKKIIWQLLRFLTYGIAHKITVNSKEAVLYFKKFYFSKKVIYLPNPIKKINKKKVLKKKLITFVGKFEYQKGIDVLIKAFFLSKIYKNGWKLQLIGDGTLFNKMQSECKKMDHFNSLVFKPYISNLDLVYSESSFLILPSRYEGTPNVILEAVSAMLPFVISDSCSEIHKIFESSYIFKNEDEKDLSRILKQIIKLKKTSINKITKNNYLILKKNFNENNVLNTWTKVLLN